MEQKAGDCLMEYTLEQVDVWKKHLDELRPLTGEKLKNIQEYYRVSLTYTSNALEGNTLTLSETKVILEDGLTIGGHPLRELYEVTGHARAYDFMWELAKAKTISLANIGKLHTLLYSQIDEKQAGVYRTQDVVITGSAYPLTEWSSIPIEMEKLEKWMQAKREELHPVTFAAQLHRRFVYIHPYIDGNGRTSRLLMNLALLQAGYEIATIPPVLRPEYIGLLERGHKDPEPFYSFIVDRVAEAQKDMMRLFHIPLKG